MLRVVLVVTLLMNLIACSSTPEWKGVYGTDENKSEQKLSVPPDLSSPDVSDSTAIPNIGLSGETYSAYSLTDHSGAGVLSAKHPDVKVVRDGINEWLEINAPAEKIWTDLSSFFTGLGFELKREDKALGVLETNWKENRYNVSTGWMAKILHKLISSGIKDKYRARLEKTDNPNITRVFITHQGLEEKATDDSQSGTFVRYWVPRKSDPGLEAEMYQRFLIYRDMDKKTAIKLAAESKAPERASIVVINDNKVLQVREGFARTWRRVGIALDRIGLLVEDRNRSGGLYYLRITDDFRNKVKDDSQGWFASLFSKGDIKLKESYLLNVSEENNITTISIYEASGAKADARFVDKLLGELKTYLD